MPLYPFQEEAVKRMLKFVRENKSHACYNACEQGLGKSIQAIALADQLQHLEKNKDFSVLIVCPAVMRLTWEDEIEKWASGGGGLIKVLISSKDLDGFDIKGCDFLVVSYALASRVEVLEKLCRRKWDLLILDEAHQLKNRKSERTRACLIDLWKRSRHRVMMSGTPCTVTVVDLYTACRKCALDHFGDFEAFVRKYSYQRRTAWSTQYFGLKHAKSLSKKIRKHFFIRYTKAEVLPELPPKTFQRISLSPELAVVERGENDQEKLELAMEGVVRAINSGQSPDIPHSLAEHRRRQGEAKVDSVVEFCEDLLQNDVPIVVFAHHKSVISSLRARLAGYSPAVITGDTSAAARSSAIHGFQRGDTNLFIANLVAGGVGITLHRSSICVMAELPWDPATLAQASDRLHRIGQKNPVTVYYFVVRKSIDEAISKAVLGRAKLLSQVVDN